MVYASRVRSRASRNSSFDAVLTRASSSPVVGQVETSISPEPRHWPSYTPCTSPAGLIPKADRILEARVESARAVEMGFRALMTCLAVVNMVNFTVKSPDGLQTGKEFKLETCCRSDLVRERKIRFTLARAVRQLAPPSL